jgi:hypothetical protein
MRRSRSGRPSLIGSAARTAGRTAIIAGTATAVVGAMSGPKQRSAQPAVAQPAPAAPTPVLTDDKVTQLQKLAELQQTGVLSDEEFANLKAQILAG